MKSLAGKVNTRKKARVQVGNEYAAALALKRLENIPPATARQLFSATVTPGVDYACSVWKHAFQNYQDKSFARVQRIGAQAIVGAFRTVARDVAEAKASIPPVQHRQAIRALKFWVNLHTLPEWHPLSVQRPFNCKRYTTPLIKLAKTFRKSTSLKSRGSTHSPFHLGRGGSLTS